MRIGFPLTVDGPGGTRTWVRTFSEYCIEKGHEVFYNHDEKVDVFITIANASKYEQLIKLKREGAKIIHRIDGLFFQYHVKDEVIPEEVNKTLKRNMELADLIVCQSKFTEELMKYFLPNSNIPRTIIYNSPNKSIFTPEGKQIERGNDKKLILSIAYWGVKNMARYSMKIIVDVARRLPQYEFWILGLGYPENQEFIESANLPNITKVDLGNPIPRDKMPEYLRAADLILHTRPHDACSNLILETISINKPIVGLNSGSTPELLGDAGLVGECIGDFKKLPQVNSSDLAKKVIRTFNNYEYYKNKITKRSKMFSHEIMCEAYLNEIYKVLSK